MTATISFDLDGTLVTSASGPVFRRVIGELGGDDTTRAEVLRRHEELLLRHPFEAYDWAGIISSTVGADAETVLRMLVGGLADAVPTLIHAGTVDALAALRAGGRRVVVLTNGRRAYQEPVLATAGISPVIDELVTSDDVGETKPAPAMFSTARGGSAGLVHVGDRLDHDVIGALAAGATTVLLRTDAPLTGWTSELAAEDPPTVRDYLLAISESEGTTTVDPRSRDWWPDLVAADLSAALSLLDASPDR